MVKGLDIDVDTKSKRISYCEIKSIQIEVDLSGEAAGITAEVAGRVEVVEVVVVDSEELVASDVGLIARM